MSRLAERAYRPGDPLPPVGSHCLVAGAHTDITSDQDRAYTLKLVIGYTLQRSRKRMAYDDLDAFVGDAKRRHDAMAARALGLTPLAQEPTP